MSAGANAGTKKTGRTILSKALIIQEYKRRLRDNIKSLSDNFNNIISAAKVSIVYHSVMAALGFSEV